MSDTLPPPAILLTVDLPMLKGGAVKAQPFYTADQMRAYAAAAVAEERERLALLCEAAESNAGPLVAKAFAQIVRGMIWSYETDEWVWPDAENRPRAAL